MQVEDLQVWSEFASSRAHLLRHGSDEWPANKILLQLAIEHADESPLTKAAEAWGFNQVQEPITIWHRAVEWLDDGAHHGRPKGIPPRPFEFVITTDFQIQKVLMLSNAHLAIVHKSNVYSVWEITPSVRKIYSHFIEESLNDSEQIQHMRKAAGIGSHPQNTHWSQPEIIADENMNSPSSGYENFQAGTQFEFEGVHVHLRKDGCVQLGETELIVGEGPVQLHCLGASDMLVSCGSCSGASSRLILISPCRLKEYCGLDGGTYRLIAGALVSGSPLFYCRNEMCVVLNENLILSLGWRSQNAMRDQSWSELFGLEENGITFLGESHFLGDWPIVGIGFGEDRAIHLQVESRQYVWVHPYDDVWDRVGPCGYPRSHYAPFIWMEEPNEERLVIPDGILNSNLQVEETEEGPIILEGERITRWITDNTPYAYIPLDDSRILCVEDTGFTMLNKSEFTPKDS